MADMAAFNEEQRELLQRILDDPKTECEKAFREVELTGKSQPKEWEPTLCGMHGLMWHVFQRGWKAKGLEPHCVRDGGCVCDGDTEGVRATCHEWRKADYKSVW